ncbi:hypothetical protein ACQP1W_15440 [Spirillospora sp. CA-255316]
MWLLGVAGRLRPVASARGASTWSRAPAPRARTTLRAAVLRHRGTVGTVGFPPPAPRFGSAAVPGTGLGATLGGRPRLGRAGPGDGSARPGGGRSPAAALSGTAPAAAAFGSARTRHPAARGLVPVARAVLGGGRPRVPLAAAARLRHATARQGPRARTAGRLAALVLRTAPAGFVPVHDGAG